MWYFTWILGVLLACSFAIIVGLWTDRVENKDISSKDDIK